MCIKGRPRVGYPLTSHSKTFAACYIPPSVKNVHLFSLHAYIDLTSVNLSLYIIQNIFYVFDDVVRMPQSYFFLPYRKQMFLQYNIHHHLSLYLLFSQRQYLFCHLQVCGLWLTRRLSASAGNWNGKRRTTASANSASTTLESWKPFAPSCPCSKLDEVIPTHKFLDIFIFFL